MSTQNTLGDGPVEAQYIEQMEELAHFLDEHLNGPRPREGRKHGFILMMFEFGEPKEGDRVNYISNARREDVIATLKHQLARFEGQPDVQGRA